MIGNKFENALWSTRFIVLISVVLSIISSIILFLLGGWDIIQAIIYKNPLLNNDIERIINKRPIDYSWEYKRFRRSPDPSLDPYKNI